jgi:hypothetical protein
MDLKQIKYWSVLSICPALLASAADKQQPELSLSLIPIVTIRQNGERAQLATLHDVQQRRMKPTILSTNFSAVSAERWPVGLVPIFSVEREDGHFELRRLPRRGVENGSDPLFFALPREDEREATAIAGAWTCTATNAEGSQHWVGWELAVNGTQLAGRFDQQTEYRFAFVTGGTFVSNRFELSVEHTNDRYLLTGEWRDGAMTGNWRQEDGPQRGMWRATRPPAVRIPSAESTAPLFEWRKKGSEERAYLMNGKSPGQDWISASAPLCRVWRNK